MSDAKRQEIREKVETGQARLLEREKALAETAAQARDRAVGFAREHPLMLISGGLAIGVAISALFPRSPTRRIGSKAMTMAASIAKFGIAYGRKAAEAAEDATRDVRHTGREKFDELSGAIEDGGASLREKLGFGKKA